MHINVKEIILEALNSISNNEIKGSHYTVELNELGITSNIFVNLIVDLERLLNIEIPNEYLLIDNVKTLENLDCIITEIIMARTN